jgi:hypothetical protein
MPADAYTMCFKRNVPSFKKHQQPLYPAFPCYIEIIDLHFWLVSLLGEVSVTDHGINARFMVVGESRGNQNVKASISNNKLRYQHIFINFSWFKTRQCPGTNTPSQPIKSGPAWKGLITLLTKRNRFDSIQFDSIQLLFYLRITKPFEGQL